MAYFVLNLPIVSCMHSMGGVKGEWMYQLGSCVRTRVVENSNEGAEELGNDDALV